jgi:tetratricopeptide (TPR) repeat protein
MCLSRTFRVFLAVLVLFLVPQAHAAMRPDEVNLEARLFDIKLLHFNPTDKVELLEQYFRKNIVNFRDLAGAYLETVEYNRSRVLKDFSAARRESLIQGWLDRLEEDHPDLGPRLDSARLYLSWATLAEGGSIKPDQAEALRIKTREVLDGLDVSGWSYLVAGLVVDLIGLRAPSKEAPTPALTTDPAPLQPLHELWEKAGELAGNQDAHLHFLLGELLTQTLDTTETPVYCKRIATEYEKSLLVSPSDKQLYSAVAGRYHEIYESLSSKEAQLPFWFEELVFKRLIAVEPTNARAHNNLSFLYAQYGVNLKDALKEAQIANQLVPGDPNMLDTLGWAYYKTGNAQKGIQVLTQALELDDTLADVHFHIATIYYDLKEHEKAVEHFRATVTLDPKNAFAMNNLAYLFSERGANLKEGLELVSKALALQPENSAFLDTRGWLFYRLGQYDEADANVSKAIQLQPEVSELHLHKGQIALARGHYKVATDHFEKALTYQPKNPELARLLARIYVLNGIRQGLTRFARIHSVQRKQNFEVFYRAMAEVYQVDGLYKDAIEVLERYTALPDGTPPVSVSGVFAPLETAPPPRIPLKADFSSAVRRLPALTDMVVTLEHTGLEHLLNLVIENVRLPFPLAPFRDHILPRLPHRVVLGFRAATSRDEEGPSNVALLQLEAAHIKQYATRLAQLGETTIQIPGASAKIYLSSWSYKDQQLGSIGVPGMMLHYLIMDGAIAVSRRKSALVLLVDQPVEKVPDLAKSASFKDFVERLDPRSDAVLVGHIPALLAGKAGEKLKADERSFLEGIDLICSQYSFEEDQDGLRELSQIYPKTGVHLVGAAAKAESFARRSIGRFPASELLQIESNFGLTEGRVHGDILIRGVRNWARELLKRLSGLGIELPDLRIEPEEEPSPSSVPGQAPTSGTEKGEK